jgi:hypothetical protein
MSAFKRELIKTLIAFCVGIVLGIIVIANKGEELGLIMPFYCVGIVYGWKELFKLLAILTGKSVKGGSFATYFGGMSGFTL